MSVHARLDWTRGMQFVARAGDGPAMILDNPEGGSGATPMQHVLVGIAGCTAMDVVSILNKKRASLDALHVNISGEQADEHPRRYTRITIEFVIAGKGVRENDVARAIELSATKYCSAIASVNAQVRHTFRIVEQAS